MQGVCSHADFEQFLAWGQQQCAEVGVTFASSAASPTVTAPGSSFATAIASSRPISTSFAPASSTSSSTAVPSSSPTPVDFAQNSNPTTTGSTGSTFSNSPVSSTPVPSSGGGLSAGAKAGIGVGAALGSVLILGLLLLLFYRERRKRSTALSQQQQSQPPPQPLPYPVSEQKLDSSSGATPATAVSQGTGGEVTSSATWTTHEHKLPSATEYELTGDNPAPQQHNLEGGHGEPQSTVL